MMRWMMGFRKDQKGQSMSEYGLLVALLAIVAIVGVMFMGPKLQDAFSDIGSWLDKRPTP